jgi:hypothetical protein
MLYIFRCVEKSHLLIEFIQKGKQIIGNYVFFYHSINKMGSVDVGQIYFIVKFRQFPWFLVTPIIPTFAWQNSTPRFSLPGLDG